MQKIVAKPVINKQGFSSANCPSLCEKYSLLEPYERDMKLIGRDQTWDMAGNRMNGVSLKI